MGAGSVLWTCPCFHRIKKSISIEILEKECDTISKGKHVFEKC